MDKVNVYEAKAHFSDLLKRAESGEEIVIARSGRPVARLVPMPPQGRERVAGGWHGRVEIAPDFDELPAALAAAFAGHE